MPTQPSEILALFEGGKAPLTGRLWAGDWWTLCQALAQRPGWTAFDQAVMATLPTDLARGPLAAWQHGIQDPVWSQIAPRFDDPKFNHYLATALLQLHCARLAATLDKGWTVRGAPLDAEQARTIAGLSQTTGRPERELRHWIGRLVDPAPDPYRQRINALWVSTSGDGGGTAFLTLGLVPDAKGLILSDPRLAFATIEPDFIAACAHGWQAARALLQGRDGLAWPEATGIAWDWTWRGNPSACPARLGGPSAGAAFALAAYVLYRRVERAARGEDWTLRRAGDDAPLLDPEITKGIAVSAKIDPGRLTLNEVGGIEAKLVAVTRGQLPHLHTVLLAGDQRPVAGTGGGTGFDLAFARTLADGVDRLDLLLARRWSDTRLYGAGAEIARFLPIYLGRPGQAVPFGGHTAARAELAAWIANTGRNKPPYLLLTAPAGRGKSALLARFVTDFWLQEQDALLYLPIGPRSDLYRDLTIARALLTRLCALHGEPLGDIADSPPASLFEQARGLLGRALRDGRRLLVILDGLDEAADWRPLVKLCPLTPPEGLRVLVAARSVIGESDRAVWLDRLGWTAEGLAQVVELDLLSAEDIRDVMRRMGAPLDQIANDTLVGQLHRVTDGGDPLLVGLWVETLWQQRQQVARETTAQLLARLTGTHAGLDAFFDRWWQDQESIWTAQREAGGLAPGRGRIEELLAVLAHAKGPLLRRDLIEHLLPGWDLGWLADDALAGYLEPLGRFLIGDGINQGYLFQHRRFAEYFAGKVPEQGRTAIERRFLDWGARTLRGLNAWAEAERRGASPVSASAGAATATVREETVELIAPRDAPAYLVQCYGRHLQDRYELRAAEAARAEGAAERFRAASARAAVLTALQALLTEGWLRAWERVEGGTFSGYLTDVNRIWAAASNENREAADHLDQQLPHLGTELRCALYNASVNSLASNLPSQLPALNLAAGLLTEADALRAGLRISDAEHRARAMICLANYSHGALREQAFDEALSAVEQTDRCHYLLRQIPPRRRPLRSGWVRDMLREATTYFGTDWGNTEGKDIKENNEYVQEVVISLAPHLPNSALTEVLEVVIGLEFTTIKAKALSALAHRLPPSLLRRALLDSQRIYDDRRCRLPLAALTPFLPVSKREPIIQALMLDTYDWHGWNIRQFWDFITPALTQTLVPHALATAKAIQDTEYKAIYFANLAPQLSALQKAGALKDLISDARNLPDVSQRCRVLSKLTVLSSLPPEPELSALVSETLERVQSLKETWIRANAIADISPILASDLLDEALAAANAIEQLAPRCFALAHLARHIPEPHKSSAIHDALAIAINLSDISEIHPALGILAQQISGPDFFEALHKLLKKATRMKSNKSGTAILYDIMPCLPPDLIVDTLTICECLKDRYERAECLLQLATHFDQLSTPRFQRAVIDLATVSSNIADNHTIVESLVSLASNLSEKLLYATLTAVDQIADTKTRIEHLSRLAPFCPERVLEKAPPLIRAIADPCTRAHAYFSVAAMLPEPQTATLLAEAFSTAIKIGDLHIFWLLFTKDAPQLSESARTEALKKTLEAARKVEHAFTRASLLIMVAEHLPHSESTTICREALSSIENIEDAGEQGEALRDIAELLPAELLHRALKCANRIKKRTERRNSLLVLVPRLSGKDLAIAIRSTITSLRRSDDDWTKAEAASELAQYLSPPLLRNIFALIKGIQMRQLRRSALADLARDLPEAMTSTAIATAIAAFDDQPSKVEFLTAFAPRLPDGAKAQALREILAGIPAIDSLSDRAMIIQDVVPHLPPSLIAKALVTAEECETLSNFAEQLPESLISKAFTAALRCLHHPQSRALFLVSLAPRLSNWEKTQAFREVLVAIRGVNRTWIKTIVLTDIIAHAPLEQMKTVVSETIRAAHGLLSPEAIAEIIAKRSPNLCKELIPEMLRLTEVIENDTAKGEALLSFAKHLTPSLLPDGISAASCIQDEALQYMTVLVLAARLPRPERGKALRDAYTLALRGKISLAMHNKFLRDVPERSRGDVATLLLAVTVMQVESLDSDQRTDIFAALSTTLLP